MAGEGLPNVLRPMQVTSLSMGHFYVYFPVFSIDIIFLLRVACLTSELAIAGHPIEGLM
jgi:hypothetical protein